MSKMEGAAHCALNRRVALLRNAVRCHKDLDSSRLPSVCRANQFYVLPMKSEPNNNNDTSVLYESLDVFKFWMLTLLRKGKNAFSCIPQITLFTERQGRATGFHPA